jgi:hypothetical protein
MGAGAVYEPLDAASLVAWWPVQRDPHQIVVVACDAEKAPKKRGNGRLISRPLPAALF